MVIRKMMNRCKSIYTAIDFLIHAVCAPFDIFELACAYGYLGMAKFIYFMDLPDAKFYDEDNCYRNEETGFILACASGHLHIAQWIYSLDNINVHADNDRAFALTLARENNHPHIIAWLQSLDIVCVDK